MANKRYGCKSLKGFFIYMKTLKMSMRKMKRRRRVMMRKMSRRGGEGGEGGGR